MISLREQLNRSQALVSDNAIVRLRKSAIDDKEIDASTQIIAESYALLERMEKAGIFQDPSYKDFP